jgi:hypothetical protein
MQIRLKYDSLNSVCTITKGIRGCIFSCVQPFYGRVVSNLDRSVHRSLWVLVAHSSFIEGSLTTKNTASGHFKLVYGS